SFRSKILREYPQDDNAVRSYDLRYVSSASRVIRQLAPIFLPLRSPDSSVASTSASFTPRAFAASAGESRSGTVPGAAAIDVPGAAGGAVGDAIVLAVCCIIC